MLEPTTVCNHVGQCVLDLEQSTRFYVELLGFEVDRTLELPDAAITDFLMIPAPVGLTAVYLRLGEFQLELMHFAESDNPPFSPRVFNEPGLTHLSLSVADLDDVTDRVEAFGGQIVNRLPTVSLVRDPDGQLLELLPMSYRQQRG